MLKSSADCPFPGLFSGPGEGAAHPRVQASTSPFILIRIMVSSFPSIGRLFAGIGSFHLAWISALHAQSPAIRGTLADYLELDSSGVTIGKAVFSGFQMLPRQSGTSGFRTDFIEVVPLTDDPASPGFRFEIMDGATAEDFFELRFSFRVSNVFFEGASLSLSTVSVRSNSNAGVDVLADLSNSGGDPGSLARLIAFAAPGGIGDLQTSASFVPFNNLTVEIDALIDGGGEGRAGEITASIGSATLRLKASPPAPASLLRLSRAGLVNPALFFIEFFAAPGTAHVVKASTTLVDGFPTPVALSAGDGLTDVSGFERVEFDVSSFPPNQFFRIEKSS